MVKSTSRIGTQMQNQVTKSEASIANALAAARGKKILRHIKQDRYLLVIFAVPFLYFLFFHYLPMFGVAIAFKKFSVIKGFVRSPWVGFFYFMKFFEDPYFWRVVRNTILLNVYSLFWAFPAPVVLALLLNELRSQGLKRLTQTVTYLPHFISTVVVCGMVVNFFASDGIINGITGLFGFKSVPFMTRPEWFRTIYIGSGIWQQAGWGSIIYMSALSAINPELYEAAIADGAGRWRQAVSISLPGIAPTIVIMFILRCGDIMDVGFEKVFLLYNGSTYETADVISTYVYRVGLIGADFSYGTAVNLFKSVIALLFIYSANTLSRKIGETSLW